MVRRPPLRATVALPSRSAPQGAHSPLPGRTPTTLCGSYSVVTHCAAQADTRGARRRAIATFMAEKYICRYPACFLSAGPGRGRQSKARPASATTSLLSPHRPRGRSGRAATGACAARPPSPAAPPRPADAAPRPGGRAAAAYKEGGGGGRILMERSASPPLSSPLSRRDNRLSLFLFFSPSQQPPAPGPPMRAVAVIAALAALAGVCVCVCVGTVR